MAHARFAVAAIVASVTIAVGLPEVIKQWCTSVHAQTQTAPPESTIWDHNGSVMYLVVNGSSREIYYQKPRPGMLDAGARPGSDYSAVKSTADNIWEQRTFLILIADQSRSKLKDRFLTINGSC
jgi:hypothetical protein